MNLNLLWDKMVEEFGVEGNTVTPSREIEVKVMIELYKRVV